ncbi:MAG: phenylalanine--tRNA ligase subunit alpha [Anaerolineales bacterium]|nr:phenylalanine--tRNA ligase subunit alpha [Anaerolineales bacterium]
MLDQLNPIEHALSAALTALDAVTDAAALERWRVAHLGRNSPLMTLLGDLGKLSKEERPAIGKRGNEVKRALEDALAAKTEALRRAEMEHAMRAGAVDVTLPGRPLPRGRLHPAIATLRKIYAVWAEMGFQVYRSREVETDDYNFGLLNMPPHHPARDIWDTFFTTTPNVILRTHTSPGQIHAMREFCPEPIRVILPGMCYRYEQITARADIQFYQVEGLAVGRRVTMSDLKGTLSDFARRMFGQKVRTRFRADHFPFTEPSAEMDVECFLCDGKGCPVCKQSGWLEILGCGMVHPTVLQNGGYDPHVYSGFAFGMGPQRITMLMHKIEDIRYFLANDMRFLEQF